MASATNIDHVKNRWAAGPSYGPILTPTDLYVLGCGVQINPVFESKDGDFHLLFNIATGRTGGFNPDDRNADLPFNARDEPATLPRLTEIVIITKSSPWCSIVQNANGVSCGDICTRLWRDYTDNPITDAEFATLPARYQDMTRRISAANQQAGVGAYTSQVRGLKRCDWLRDKVWFDVMYPDERYTHDRLGFSAPNIFVMSLAS